ncbi:SIMPL domain-containing protein [Pseudoalteromonas sp. SMN1298-MNA-CIBAN-0114]|uniref:SIMPL domain-containing protein n=1 Tax=Pseudoalteromonas sp. SMN1298-MNA-CIBAN-0114 TaxID=3140428 RepID=UPI00331E353D
MKFITAILLTLFPLITFANSSLPTSRHIAVQGTAEVLANPDIAKILFQIISIKNDPLAAKNDLNNKVNLLIDGLNQFEITADDVVASSVKVEKTGMDYIETGHQAPAEYAAIRTFEVTLKNIERVNDLSDFLLSLKVNAIQNTEFLSSKAELLQAQATQQALNNAKEKANVLANSFGTKVGEVRTISSTQKSVYSGFGAAVKKIDRVNPMSDSFPKARKNYLQQTVSFKSSINVVFDLEVND